MIEKILSLKFSLRTLLARYPDIFYPVYLYGLLYKFRAIRHRFVNRNTQIVIEGFQRSANTFAVIAFEYAQPTPVNIAHHIHAPAQIIRALKWKIPTLVVIRNPRDAVASFVVKWPEVSIEQALKFYIYFYEPIAEYRSEYVIGDFEEVTQHFSKTIQRINDKFNTNFALFSDSDEDKKKVLASIVEERSSFDLELNVKKIDKKALVQDMVNNHSQLLQECELIYQEYTQKSLIH